MLLSSIANSSAVCVLQDPKAPKRPMSAYLVFLERYREQEKKLNPELKMADIIKKLALKWRDASDEEKRECEVRLSILVGAPCLLSYTSGGH